MGRFRWVKRKRIWIPIVAVLTVLVVVSFFRGADESTPMAFSDVMSAARDGKLESVDVRGTRLDVRLRGDSTKYSAEAGSGTDVARSLQEAASGTPTTSSNVELRFHRTTSGRVWVAWLVQVALAGVVVYVAMRLALRHTQRP